jgi:hypothetical protein
MASAPYRRGIELYAFPVLAYTDEAQFAYHHRAEAARPALELAWMRVPEERPSERPIADSRAFEFLNPFSPAPAGLRATGVPGPDPGQTRTPSDQELMQTAPTRKIVRAEPSLWKQFSQLIYTAVAPRHELAPPQRIPEGLISQLRPLPVAFPVWVKFPEFGTALATHYMCIESARSFGADAVLNYYVLKLKPYGLIKGEPFSQGLWEVPAAYCMRMAMAVGAVDQDQGSVLIYTDEGRSRAITWAEFRMTPGPAYDVARKALLLQYPSMLLAEFATVPDLPGAPPTPAGEPTTFERVVQSMPAAVFVQPAAAPAATEEEPAAAQIKHRR